MLNSTGIVVGQGGSLLDKLQILPVTFANTHYAMCLFCRPLRVVRKRKLNLHLWLWHGIEYGEVRNG